MDMIVVPNTIYSVGIYSVSHFARVGLVPSTKQILKGFRKGRSWMQFEVRPKSWTERTTASSHSRVSASRAIREESGRDTRSLRGVPCFS